MNRTIVFLLIATALPAAGCLGPQAECPDTTPTTAARPTRFPGETLTILDHGAFSFFSDLKPLFEAQTGATVKQISGGDAGKALQQALLGAGNPPADVLYGVDNALFFSPRVLETCLYVPYEPAGLAAVDPTVVNVDQFRVEGALWATPVDHGYVGVNYDLRLAEGSPPPPTSLRDLASSTWAPKFVTEDPRESSPGLGFLLATIDTFGEKGPYTWRDWWREFFDHGGLVVPDWTTAYVFHFSGGYGAGDAANRGDRSLVTSYTTSPAYEASFSGSPPSVSLEPPYGVFHQVETMGILRGSSHVGLAQAWIDFCLTSSFQDRASEMLAMYPVVRNATVIDAFRTHATPPERLVPARLTAAQIGEGLDGWLEEWTALYRA